ncbi:hypothetical protein EDB81DRAFT_807838 [Dactylonectria macrodidyma]|uniref:Uncharacterized protein n=1 Tax=Dactylonectria macrodidyma TaxID=307937 RepID=A0A9P9IRX0_9HYPO|nr:hypothetical protein EDB81DRAFT_807838 [Dactylonectria macrodidyma]
MDSPMEHHAQVEDFTPSPNWRREILPTFMVLLGLSGQILFTIMPTIENSSISVSEPARIQTFLSLAWVFFVSGFALCLAMLPLYYGDGIERRLSQHSYHTVIGIGWALVQITTALGFIFLSFIVKEYTTPGGWISLILLSSSILTAIACVLADMWFLIKYMIYPIKNCLNDTNRYADA